MVGLYSTIGRKNGVKMEKVSISLAFLSLNATRIFFFYSLDIIRCVIFWWENCPSYIFCQTQLYYVHILSHFTLIDTKTNWLLLQLSRCYKDITF